MIKDTATYHSRVLGDYLEEKALYPGKKILYPRVDEIVFDILKSAGCELKREEIIQRFQKEPNCEDIEVRSISNMVSGALHGLVKKRKIEHTRYGHYKVIFPLTNREIVSDILKSAGCELKREEIIRRFQKEQNCKDPNVSEIVSEALDGLVKESKIERVLSTNITK